MAPADDAAAGGGGLERGVGERVGLARGDDDDVGGAVDALDVVDGSPPGARGRPRRASRQLLERPPVALLAAPRRAGDQRDDVVAVAQRGRPSARTSTSCPFQPEIRPSTATTGAVPRAGPSAPRAASRGGPAGVDGQPVVEDERRRAAPNCCRGASETHGSASAVSSSRR